MTQTVMRAVTTPEDSLTEYATGQLSPVKHIMLSCQREICRRVDDAITFQEEMSATLMRDDGRARALSPEFMGNVLAALPKTQDGTAISNDNRDPGSFMAPPTLRQLLGHGLRDIRWRSLVPGVAVHDIIGDRKFDGDRLYLMRVKSGIKMPDHGHDGEEWTLLLRGGYVVDGQRYTRGDLHVEAGGALHAPEILDGEDCICLVMTQAPIKIRSVIARILQPLLGI